MKENHSFFAVTIVACMAGCGGKLLDLSGNKGEPGYATPDTIDSEDDAGRGVPVTIASHQYGATAVAVDNTRIYWATGGFVVRHTEPPVERAVVRSCAKANCAATLVTYAMQQDDLIGLAVNKTHVYWMRRALHPGTPGVILACPIAGCDGSPTVVATRVVPTNLEVDDTHVYWESVDDTILACAADNCSSPTLVALTGSTVSGRNDLVLHAERVYWLARGPNNTGSILSAAKDGSGPVTAVVRDVPSLASIAIDDGRVYWTERHSFGAVKACPLAGCTGDPEVVARAQLHPTLLATRAGFVSWFVSENGAPSFEAEGPISPGGLVGCAAPHCESGPTALAPRQFGPRDVAVDDTHIYWVVAGENEVGVSPSAYEGSVRRIRKPK